jgi:zinc protease
MLVASFVRKIRQVSCYSLVANLRLVVFMCVASLTPVLISCVSGPKSESGFFGGNSREASSGYRLAPFTEKLLPNGLRVLFVPDDKLPYISYSLLIRSGSAQDPSGQAGLSSFVAEVLDKGTVKRGAPEVARDLDRLGAEFDASASYDYSMVGLSGLSIHGEVLLSNLIEIVTQPAFSDAEIERTRKQTLAQIERRVDNPDAYTDLAFAEYLFGNHPYGRPVGGSLESVRSIKKKNIIQHYLRHYRPGQSILAVIGKITPDLQSKIEKEFGAWTNRDVPSDTFPPIPKVQGKKFRLVDKPGLVQAQIRIGHPGIRRDSDQFLALRVANTILGGAFASRLNDRLRKELGLTYSVSSFFDARQDVGPFEISTFTKNESIGQAVAETLKLIGQFRQDGVTSAEVERAKGYLKGIFPTAIETPEKLALNLLILRNYGIADSYLTNYLGEIDRLSVADVNRAIRAHISEENVKVVVHASASAALAQLQPLASHDSPVEVVKAGQ